MIATDQTTLLREALTLLSQGNPHGARIVLDDAIDGTTDVGFAAMRAANWIDLGQPLQASSLLAKKLAGI